jgi:Ankyrin repeats (3 copies)
LQNGNANSIEANTDTHGGMTALHLASFNGHLEIVKYLLQNGNANVEAKENDGWTALHWASRYGNLAILGFLVYGSFVHLAYIGLCGVAQQRIHHDKFVRIIVHRPPFLTFPHVPETRCQKRNLAEPMIINWYVIGLDFFSSKSPNVSKNSSSSSSIPQRYDHADSYFIKHGNGRMIPRLDVGLHTMKVGGT